jgi:hypothetical protein
VGDVFKKYPLNNAKALVVGDGYIKKEREREK